MNCGSVMRDTNPPGCFVCEMDLGHSGPHRSGVAMWTAEGAEQLGMWFNRAMICAICSKEWIATHPASATRLECPSCGHMNDVVLGKQ